MNKILVVEDDFNIQDIVAFNLEKEGFQVFTAENGIEALEILEEEDDISLVVMDIMMPEMDGFECTDKIREKSDIPIIILTALETESDKLKGFDMNINDYVVKPFSVKELMARVKNQLRLAQMNNKDLTNKNIIQINDIVFNRVENTVKVGNKEDVLTNTEYLLLMYLYEHPNEIFTREQLLKAIWKSDVGEGRIVDVAVRRLREKIEETPSEPKTLKTRRSRGYYLDLK